MAYTDFLKQAQDLISYTDKDDSRQLVTPSSETGGLLLALTCSVIGLAQQVQQQNELLSRT